MIAEPTRAKELGVTAHTLARTIHSHPTMNEAIMEAAEAALGQAIQCFFNLLFFKFNTFI